MYADTMPGEIAAWVQAEQAKCAALRPGEWVADESRIEDRSSEYQGDYIHCVRSPGTAISIGISSRPREPEVAFIASARTGYPVLLACYAGLLARHAEAEQLVQNNSHGKYRVAMLALRTEIASLHAALSAQGLIGGDE